MSPQFGFHLGVATLCKIFLDPSDRPSLLHSTVIGGSGGLVMRHCDCSIVFRDCRALASYCNAFGCLFNVCKVLLSLNLLFFYWIWRIVSLSHAFFDFVFCSSLSMVRGREVQTLWPMASPLTFYSLALFWECVYHGLSSFMANVAYPV